MPKTVPDISEEQQNMPALSGPDRRIADTPAHSEAMAALAQTDACESAVTPPKARRLKILRFSMLQLVRIWAHLPNRARHSRPGEALGRLIHYLVREVFERHQYFATYFLRNRPELQVISQLVKSRPMSSAIRISVLACSKGAEVYSIAWAIRSARPDLELHINAIDISRDIVEFAERGVYTYGSAGLGNDKTDRIASGHDAIARNTERDQGSSIFERVTPAEFEQMFELTGDQAAIRPWLRRGISWSCGDAGNPELAQRIGLQDFVVANRFLCHMSPADAERCLRNIAQLVRPGGYLFVSGIDLNVRAKVARSLRWNPVPDLIREIHDGDCSIRDGWPLNYWALEPFRSDRPDWQLRYASVFQIGQAS
jgi:chemotaxis protein methyltransferase CheR